MADYDARFNRLALSAADLKQVTALQKPGEPWPDALIEDYLNIIRDLIELADLIDQNAATIIKDIDIALQEVAASKSRISKLYGKVNELASLAEESPQLESAFPGKQKSMLSALRRDVDSFYPQKCAFCSLAGNGAAVPTVTKSYNIQSIFRSNIGTYDFSFVNSTISGVSFVTNAVFSSSFRIAGNANSDLYSVEFLPIAGGFTIYVYQHTIVGPKITKNLYDLKTLDTLDVVLLASSGSLYQAL